MYRNGGRQLAPIFVASVLASLLPKGAVLWGGVGMAMTLADKSDTSRLNSARPARFSTL